MFTTLVEPSTQSLRERKTAPWEFQTKLLHYFFTSNNKSNLHFPAKETWQAEGLVLTWVRVFFSFWGCLNFRLEGQAQFSNRCHPGCIARTVYASCIFTGKSWRVRQSLLLGVWLLVTTSFFPLFFTVLKTLAGPLYLQIKNMLTSAQKITTADYINFHVRLKRSISVL